MSDATDTTAELLKRMKSQRFVMLTTIDEDGALISRPMTVQEFDDWTFAFIAQDDDATVQQSDGREVNLSVMDGGNYISISGRGSVSRSVAEKKELWGRLNEAYAGDAEDPDNVILRVDAHQGAYWSAGNPVAQMIGLAKAAITGDAPDGEHGATEI
ncbi:pyridoxamine 5'-phosphate oxidase family protein [Microbacterium gorillae]|uniref:pyridoxamine 5'-phosphate oxidase family protein n=1 Tax=Microbacterium gorillae TaxID=1231063 RepID=UPI00058EFEC3|nr:pyridoxamine 5'-phosphate oxidase family protein [Microbacterium gorillae]